MKKDFQQISETKEWIAQALIDLSKSMPYEDITITQIAKRAGVSRMTYYRYYTCKDDILSDYMDYLSELVAKRFRESLKSDSVSFLEQQFDLLIENDAYVKCLVTCNKTDIMRKAINRNIENLNLDYTEKMYVKFYAGGIFNLLLDWFTKQHVNKDEYIKSIIRMTRRSVMNDAICAYQTRFNQL